MSREAHVRFWEGLRVRFPGATQLSNRLALNLKLVIFEVNF
jgi:hypothetical protein